MAELPDPDFRLEGLRIWVHGREFPDSADYWDGNWLDVTVRVEAPGAWVETRRAMVRTDEIASFAAEVKQLHVALAGTATLACLEPELQVRLEGDGLGHIAMTVELTPDQMTQSHTFRFDTDQTWLPPLLAQCEAVLERYPVRGSRRTRDG